MAATVFVFDVLVTLVLSGYLLYSYGNWMRQRLAVTLAVLVAWYFSFLIIFVLPLDVSSTAYRQCVNSSLADMSANHSEFIAATAAPSTTTEAPEVTTTNPGIITEKEINQTRSGLIDEPKLSAVHTKCAEPYSLLDPQVLPDLWKVVYWSSQFLTWLILPMMQSYTQAGEFSPSGKLKSALWDNMIYYSSLMFIALILIVYIAMQPELHLNWERVKAIAASASNTWGLFVLVLMLGYGLVEVPRNLWRSTQRGYQLTRAYFKVAKLMGEKTEAEEALDDALIALNAVSNVIGQADERRVHVETILMKVPVEMMDKVRRRRGETPFGSDPPTEKSLTKLHAQVIKALQTHKRTEAQWDDLTNRVFELEDINRNMISNEHVFKHTLSRPPSNPLSKAVFNPMVEWYWKCLIAPLLLRMAAGIAVVMSAMIIWSEVDVKKSMD